MLNIPSELMSKILLSLDQKERIRLILVSKSLNTKVLKVLGSGLLIGLIRQELNDMFGAYINFDKLYKQMKLHTPPVADQINLYKQIYYLKEGKSFLMVSNELEIYLQGFQFIPEAAFLYAQIVSRFGRYLLGATYDEKIKNAIAVSSYLDAVLLNNLTYITCISLYLQFLRKKLGNEISLEDISDDSFKDEIKEITEEIDNFLRLNMINPERKRNIGMEYFKKFINQLFLEYIDPSLIFENAYIKFMLPKWILDVLSPNLLDFLELISIYKSSVLINNKIVEKILTYTFQFPIRWLHNIYKNNFLVQLAELEKAQSSSLFDLDYYCLEFTNYPLIKKRLLESKDCPISLATLYDDFVKENMARILNNDAFKKLFCSKFLGVYTSLGIEEYMSSGSEEEDEQEIEYYDDNHPSILLIRNMLTLGFMRNTESYDALQTFADKIIKISVVFDIVTIYSTFLSLDGLKVSLDKFDEVYKASKPFSIFKEISDTNLRRLFTYPTSLIPVMGKYILKENKKKKNKITINEYINMFYGLADIITLHNKEYTKTHIFNLISFILTQQEVGKFEEINIDEVNLMLHASDSGFEKSPSKQTLFFTQPIIKSENTNIMNKTRFLHSEDIEADSQSSDGEESDGSLYHFSG